MPRHFPAFAGLVVAAALAACSSDDGGSPSTLTVAKSAASSGDAQSGTAGQPLANPLRVSVTDGGVVQNGVTVTWATTSGGTLAPATSTTDANGIAVTTWTLGAGGGAQTATASVSGASGSPVTFTAASPVVPTITVGPGGALQFSPATITIDAGQSVRFVWASNSHNVVPEAGNPSTLPNIPTVSDAPFEASVAFPSSGEFKFFCAVHSNNPASGVACVGMCGSVTVN